MKLLALRTNLDQGGYQGLPLTVYTVGTEKQPPMTRLTGFSAMQLLVTSSGSGRFRHFGQEKWDIITSDQVLYIPEGIAHEYEPIGDEPWMVGFVSFKGNGECWGFSHQPFLLEVESTARLFEYIEQIWSISGPNHDLWTASGQLYVFLAELRRLSFSKENNAIQRDGDASEYRSSIVQRATRFMQDHLFRQLTIADLSEQIGYSQKQMTRLFLHAFGTTPLQYLKQMRLDSAAVLLEERPNLPVQQVARQVGMEPVYFSRMFRREYGITPSQYRSKKITDAQNGKL
ncbi:helix-turn-helix domain-containing protein [Gorillibacterium massiliense]|uniref:helix-turn-helix domain-containing protein n=1 Tax=Gorillibacterium massiliense TaxID=1280390 RepID=UPI0004B10573|nr:AraC family transcriptional regulator [Gorillibacterium massiliense]